MGRKVGLDLDQVLEAAAEIADREGWDALSLASLATALGVRPPSLYSHVDGLAGLRRQLTLHAASLLTAELAELSRGLEGAEALTAIAKHLRAFAHRHPGLYDSFLPAPTQGEDSALAAALGEPVKLVGSVLAGMDIDPEDVIPLIRALRSTIHGFIDLELHAGFGLSEDIDDSFTTTVSLMVETIVAHSQSGSTGWGRESSPSIPSSVDTNDHAGI